MTDTGLDTLLVQDFNAATGTVTLSRYDSGQNDFDEKANSEICELSEFVDLAFQFDTAFSCSSNTILLLTSLYETRIPHSSLLYSSHMRFKDAANARESVGGLRNFTELDDLMLVGLGHLLDNDRKAVAQTLKQLPVYKYLSFLSPRSDLGLANIVFFAFDPRMHINPQRPDSSATFKRLLGADGPKGRLQRDMRIMTAPAWLVEGEHDISQPGAFLIRRLKKDSENPNPTTPGLLRTHQKFATFLRYAWLDSIRPAWCAEPLFDPSLIFADEPDTVDAFRSHMESHLD